MDASQQLFWEDAALHTLPHMKWTCALERPYANEPYKTLVLMVGQGWWKECEGTPRVCPPPPAHVQNDCTPPTLSAPVSTPARSTFLLSESHPLASESHPAPAPPPPPTPTHHPY